MSVPDQPTVFTYTGNGVTTTFAYGFYLLSLDDIVVSLDGVEQSSGFTVNGISAQSGGAVIFAVAPGTGVSVQIMRQVALERETDYQPNGDLRSQVLNSDFDRLWMALQDRNRDITRAIRYPIKDTFDGTLANAETRALNVLGFDSAGRHTYLPLPSSLGAGDLRFELGLGGTPGFKAGVDFTAGVTTQLTLSRAPLSTGNCWVYWDGVEQFDYSLVGTLITFPTPINADVSEVQVRIGTTLSTFAPPFGSITDLEVADDADIKSSKLSFLRDDAGAVAIPVKTRLSQTVDITDFGGMNLLDGVTNASAALTAALATGKRVWIPYTEGGIRLNSQVTVGTGQMIEFENPSMLVKSNSPTSIFRMTGFGDNPKITSGLRGGCTFDMNGAPAGSTAIRFGTSSGVVWGVRISDGRYSFRNCYEAIGDEASASNYTTDVRIDDVFCRSTKGRQILSRRSRGFFVFGDVYIDQQANLSQITFEGARFEDLVGIELARFDVATGGFTPTTHSDTAIALVIAGTGQAGARNSYVRVKRLLVDSTYGHGFLLQHCHNVLIDDMTCYQNTGYGAKIIDCLDVTVNSAQLVGGVGNGAASPSQHGIELISCDSVEMTNVRADLNTGDGILLTDSTHVATVNWKARNNANIGYVEAGTSNLNKNAHGFSYSNLAGTGGAGSSITIGASGTGSTTSDLTPHSGTPTQWNVGPILI